MQNKPTYGIRSCNRIQFATTTKGKSVFREYWIHEWDGQGYDVHEHINTLDEAIKRALELGYNDDAKELLHFLRGDNDDQSRKWPSIDP